MTKSYCRRIIALTSTAVLGFLLTIVGVFMIEQHRTQAEMGPILSAIFSEKFHDLDTGGHSIQILIQRKPDCQLCPGGSGFDMDSWFAQTLRMRERSLFGGKSWFAQSSRITRASFLLNSVFSTDIKTELHFPSGVQPIFVNPSDVGTTTSDFRSRFPNEGAYLIVSRVGLNLSDTEALLYIDNFCPGLCGGGTYILMRKANGVWRIADEHSIWVS